MNNMSKEQKKELVKEALSGPDRYELLGKHIKMMEEWWKANYPLPGPEASHEERERYYDHMIPRMKKNRGDSFRKEYEEDLNKKGIDYFGRPLPSNE